MACHSLTGVGLVEVGSSDERVMLVVVSVPEVFGTYQHYNYRVNVQRQAS